VRQLADGDLPQGLTARRKPESAPQPTWWKVYFPRSGSPMDTTKTDLASPYRILLALTDDADARLVTSTLASVKSVLTCKITRVRRLEEALAAQSRDPQDVAIVALHLPDAPGFPGLDLFRREAAGLPLIVYAFAADECSPSRAAQRGAHDLLV